ncbi:unnamed protein product [Mesocestoides corti]|uniref:Uncharacterized protein n=1 Tax=Mesocestoides corti TaxID=53468 RepID=A0A3P6GBA8_MESCO|nr:unnamed protein product [Mesocestoides corti]
MLEEHWLRDEVFAGGGGGGSGVGSWEDDEPVGDGKDPTLKLSPVDTVLVASSNPHEAFSSALQGIRSATSHAEVFTGLAHLQLVVSAFWRTRGFTDAASIDQPAWWEAADVDRFLRILPSCTADYHLLIQCLETALTVGLRPPYSSMLSGSANATASWLLEQLLEPSSPLAYVMRRFDAGVGATDSQRLVEVKLRVHFDTLPSLFNALLACQEFLGDTLVCGSARVPAAAESVEPVQADNLDALQFLFHWSLKFVEHHVNLPLERIAPLHTAVQILERITARNSWKASVQEIDATLQSLFTLTMRLISVFVSQSVETHAHTGTLCSCLALLHNYLLLLDSPKWRNAILPDAAFGSDWLSSPWLFRLIDHASPEVRCLALTVLAQVLLVTDVHSKLIQLEAEYSSEVNRMGFGGIWALGFRLLLDPYESPKIRSAAAHLLANLTALVPMDEAVSMKACLMVLLPLQAVRNSALAPLLLPSPPLDDTASPGFFDINDSFNSWTFSLSLARLDGLKSLAPAAHRVLRIIANIQNGDAIDVPEAVVDELNVTVAVCEFNPLVPVFVEPYTQIHIVGVGAIHCMLEVFDFFPSLHLLLENYHALPTLKSDLWRGLSSRCCTSTMSSEERSIEPLQVRGSPSTPLLVNRVCSLLVNLSQILPSLCLARCRHHQLLTLLMNMIDPSLLETLNDGVAGRALASAFSEILRFFRSLLAASAQERLFFLSDCRFLTLLVNCLTIPPQSAVNMEALWQETMLFFVALLEPETEDPEDLLLRNALHPLAARVRQWGGLVVARVIRRAVDAINASRRPTDASGDTSRSAVFDLIHTALAFLAVVLSRRASRTLEVIKQESDSGPTSIKSWHSSSLEEQSTPTARFDNPIPAALDGTTVQDVDGRDVPLSGLLAVALIPIHTALPQVRIDLDGSLLDDTGVVGGILQHGLTFGHREAHRQAVHSALKILLCTSPHAKLAALEADFMTNLFGKCRSVVEKLTLILRHPIKLRNTGSLESAKVPSEASASTASEKRVVEGRHLAWQYLTDDLLGYLELLGNMIYGSAEIKQAAIEAGLPKLAQTIWHLALIDTRLMHGLLFCLVNFSADSPSAASAILACSGPPTDPATAAAAAKPSSHARLAVVVHAAFCRGGGGGGEVGFSFADIHGEVNFSHGEMRTCFFCAAAVLPCNLLRRNTHALSPFCSKRTRALQAIVCSLTIDESMTTRWRVNGSVNNRIRSHIVWPRVLVAECVFERRYLLRRSVTHRLLPFSLQSLRLMKKAGRKKKNKAKTTTKRHWLGPALARSLREKPLGNAKGRAVRQLDDAICVKWARIETRTRLTFRRVNACWHPVASYHPFFVLPPGWERYEELSQAGTHRRHHHFCPILGVVIVPSAEPCRRGNVHFWPPDGEN